MLLLQSFTLPTTRRCWSGGVLPIMAYTRRLLPKGISFSSFGSGGSRGGARGARPPLFFDQTEALRDGKKFFETLHTPPYFKGWMTRPPLIWSSGFATVRVYERVGISLLEVYNKRSVNIINYIFNWRLFYLLPYLLQVRSPKNQRLPLPWWLQVCIPTPV